MPPPVSARPRILVDGVERPSLAERLLGLSIVRAFDAPSRCELRLLNWGPRGGQVGYLYFDRHLLDFGKAIEVHLDGASPTLFKGRVRGLEAAFRQGEPPELSVLAADRLEDLRTTRRTRTFADATVETLVHAVASDHGLSARIDLPGSLTLKLAAQVQQSDLTFLVQHLRTVDAALWADGDTLCATRRQSAAAAVSLHMGTTLLQFRATADLTGQRTGLHATGWDPTTKSAIDEQADDSSVLSELSGDQAGATILESAVGDREDLAFGAAALSSTGEAQAVARSAFKQMARRFVIASGVVTPGVSIAPGDRIDVSGVGTLVGGIYQVTSARHVFELATGMRTEFVAQKPGLPATSTNT